MEREISERDKSVLVRNYLINTPGAQKRMRPEIVDKYLNKKIESKVTNFVCTSSRDIKVKRIVLEDVETDYINQIQALDEEEDLSTRGQLPPQDKKSRPIESKLTDFTTKNDSMESLSYLQQEKDLLPTLKFSFNSEKLSSLQSY